MIDYYRLRKIAQDHGVLDPRIRLQMNKLTLYNLSTYNRYA